MLIIRDLFLGKSQFKEFLSSPEGIATNILSNRLKQLTDEGLVGKNPHYLLTDKGRSLGPILEAMLNWGLTHLQGTNALLLQANAAKRSGG